jgi:hypothetical protein
MRLKLLVQIEGIHHPAEFKKMGHCDSWTYVTNWVDAKNVSLTQLAESNRQLSGSFYRNEKDALCWSHAVVIYALLFTRQSIRDKKCM